MTVRDQVCSRLAAGLGGASPPAPPATAAAAATPTLIARIVVEYIWAGFAIREMRGAYVRVEMQDRRRVQR